MSISQNALTVLERRYLKKDENGKTIETAQDMFNRIAGAIAASDKLYDEYADVSKTAKTFYDMMSSLEFLPNSPTLMNAGRSLGQLSACFVLPIEDTMENIFEAIKQAALIHKSGGGTGFSFSRLRQQGSTVNSTGGVASGPISFMKVFNMATEAVKQGGTRRGANMGILRIDHPDIMEFIDCKANNNEINNFNISVGLTEEFMNAVESDSDYDLIDPHTKEPVKKLNARAVFDHIVDAAWHNGEPGIIFLDRLNRDNIVPSQGEIESTNPCGEQPLLPYESCNLGSINLTKMLKCADDKFSFDWDKLSETVKNAVHFLDNVIDANKYPLEKIDFVTKQTRKIGLGVMGWADSLLLMGIPYDSEEAIELGEKLMKFITDEGRAQSAVIAEKRGAFPLFSESILPQDRPQRNATITTIAPTGTLSIIGNCSSGAEPIFGYVYIRNIMDGTEMVEVNSILKNELEKRGLYSDEMMKRIAKEGTIAHIEELPEDLRRVFVSAHDISPENHIRMQAAFQRGTDNAVSKTVNFSNSATREDVAEVYSLAFHLDCKGVTIYRDGSRNEQVLNIGKVKKDEISEADSIQESNIVPRQRPDAVMGITEKVKIGCGNLYITVNYDNKGICEVFTNTGKAGGCPSQSEATARLASVALRSGIDVKAIVDQLKGIRCPSTIRQGGMKCTSCPDAIGKAIERVYKQQADLGAWPAMPEFNSKSVDSLLQPVKGNEDVAGKMRLCPECGEKLEHESGCVICRNCGYSKCG
ncbi:MAG: vitamin B12-dependent ribonucleotide reductase [Oscillospiraceae bacterium]|nr:vitamin B12-dependent ribonucleotide reductase [Oscillospiraceae bacterium]